ncbi:MAG: alpha/beta hydrolase [Deltaproteobacteria bacterium]|nr:alpha/beta hydrolase [Nannocystaceae bacterium]
MTENAAVDERFIESSGEGPTVVLLHSSGLSGRQFRKLAQALVAEHFSVVAPDLAGHGRSPALLEPASHSFRDDVQWVVELLRGCGGAHVVGHSYGAFVGLQAARDAPDAVRSLVLFEPVAFGVLGDAAREELVGADAGWGESSEDHERWLQGFIDYWDRPGAWASQREPFREELRRVGWAVREGVRTLAADRTRDEDYAQLTLPITLMTAERSPRAAREVVQVLAAALPQSQVVEIADAGHMAPLTDADAVNAAVVAALLRAR